MNTARASLRGFRDRICSSEIPRLASRGAPHWSASGRRGAVADDEQTWGVRGHPAYAVADFVEGLPDGDDVASEPQLGAVESGTRPASSPPCQLVETGRKKALQDKM
jgi:hypothetical protein